MNNTINISEQEQQLASADPLLEDRTKWFALAMNAASYLEDASLGLKCDAESYAAAIGAAKYVRDQCNALWYTQPVPVSGTWVTGDDTPILIADMTDVHVKNALSMIVRLLKAGESVAVNEIGRLEFSQEQPVPDDSQPISSQPLSIQLSAWRAERPDEWTMDEFIRLAVKLEAATPAPSPSCPPVPDECLKLLQEFSDYVHLEQSSTDGMVNYSTTNINHFAFRARAMIAAAPSPDKDRP